MVTLTDLPRGQVGRRIVDNELLLRSVQAAGAAPAKPRAGTRVTVRGYDLSPALRGPGG